MDPSTHERDLAGLRHAIDQAKIGRAEAGGDPEPVNNIEALVTLKPADEWKTGRSKPELVEAMERKFSEFPGIGLNFSQPIAMRVDELLSGVKAQLAIQLFGDDLDQLVQSAEAIERIVTGIPGAADVQTEQVTGQPQLQIKVDRAAIARYGINVEDVQETIETAVGGEAAGQVFEGIRRFDINVRLQEPFRSSPQAIGNLLISAPDRSVRVPLSQVAEIRTVVGPKQISHDNGQRRVVIQLNVRGRDMGGFVAEAQRAIAEGVRLPPGYFVTWGGQFENQQRAMKRLGLQAPVAGPDDLERIEQLADLAGRRKVIRGLVETLPERQAVAVWLRIVQELPYAEVAQRLGISEPGARTRVARGLRALADALTELEAEQLGGVG